ncbi:glutaredoxin family protein [Corynebacterium anserum]|uniref:Glutaredoxin family protein n=1 Tax=Corynebacterium anserum TaxID=2684406 RepID=A0A7G7YQ72_9CORY|nr:glutaredoxin family protein [Corynebacterium anserum]MBC2682313.1 glutaredoxin family protein [Corynebacterium anserum]QNH96642.1 glutaredoxin family protein [Corynebacterium anserum]
MKSSSPIPHHVTLLTRSTCGSCQRVERQILPVIIDANAQLDVIQVDAPDADPQLEMEFGDRVPVILVDEEEFACWEVDNDELAEQLSR